MTNARPLCSQTGCLEIAVVLEPKHLCEGCSKDAVKPETKKRKKSA